MMRLLILATLAALAVAQTHNGFAHMDLSSSSRTDEMWDGLVHFAEGEICGFPRPYIVGGAALTHWQNSRVDRFAPRATATREMKACAAGYVRSSHVAYKWSGTADAAVKIEFRDDANPCSSGNQAACDAAGLTDAAARTYNSSNWAFQAEVSAWPSGGTTKVLNMDTLLANGNCIDWQLGPVVSEKVCGPYASGVWDTSRANSFGWKNTKTGFRIGATVQSTDTSIPIAPDVTVLSGLTTPFDIFVPGDSAGEIIRICHVDTGDNTLKVGEGSGLSGTCPSVAGRGRTGGNAAALIYVAGNTNQIYATLVDPADMLMVSITSNSQMVLSDASSITAAGEYRIAHSGARIAGKSGNTVFFHATNAWNNTSGNANGMFWRGWNPSTGVGSKGAPVYPWSASTWVDAPNNNYKSIMPVISCIFVAAGSSVGCSVRLENTWFDRLQSQEYSITIKAGAPSLSTIQTREGATLHTATVHEWPDGPQVGLYDTVSAAGRYWTGAKPKAMRTGRNRARLLRSGILPIAHDVVPTSQSMVHYISGSHSHSNGTSPGWDHAASTKCAAPGTGTQPAVSATNSTQGPFYQVWWAPGNRADISPVNQWDSLFTILSDEPLNSSLTGINRVEEVALGMWRCSGYQPIYYRESNTSSAVKLCSTCTTNNTINAFGYPLSIINHTQLFTRNSPIGTEKITTVGASADGRVEIQPNDIAGHKAHFSCFAYALTGSYGYYQNCLLEGVWANQAGGNNPDFASVSDNPVLRERARGGVAGQIYQGNGQRSEAWARRDNNLAAAFARRGTPEWSYWHEHQIPMHVSILEGQHNIRNGTYYPGSDTCSTPTDLSTASKGWCFGWVFRAQRDPNVGRMNQYKLVSAGDAPNNGWDPGYNYSGWQSWMGAMLPMVHCQAKSLGIPGMDKVCNASAEFITQMTSSPSVRNHWHTIWSSSEGGIACHPIGSIPFSPNCSSRDLSVGTAFAFPTVAMYDTAQTGVTNSWATQQSVDPPDAIVSRWSMSSMIPAAAGPLSYAGGASTARARQFVERIRGLKSAQGAGPGWALESPEWLKINLRVSGTRVMFDRPQDQAACSIKVRASGDSQSSETFDAVTLAAGIAQAVTLGSTPSSGSIVDLYCGPYRGTYVVP